MAQLQHQEWRLRQQRGIGQWEIKYLCFVKNGNLHFTANLFLFLHLKCESLLDSKLMCLRWQQWDKGNLAFVSTMLLFHSVIF